MSIVSIRKIGSTKAGNVNKAYLIKDGVNKLGSSSLVVSTASYSTGSLSGAPTITPSSTYLTIAYEYIGTSWMRGCAYFQNKIHLTEGSLLCMTFEKSVGYDEINQKDFYTRWGFGYCSSISTSSAVVPAADFNYSRSEAHTLVTCKLPIFSTGDFYVYPFMTSLTTTNTDGVEINIKDMWIEYPKAKMLYHNGFRDVAWDMSNTYIAQDTGYINSGTITETNTLTMQTESVKSAVVAITTDEKIDFSKYSTLYIEARFGNYFNVYAVDVSSLTSGYIVLSTWNTQVTNSTTRSGVFISNTKQYYNFADYNNPLARLNFYTSDQPLGEPLVIKQVWLF